MVAWAHSLKVERHDVPRRQHHTNTGVRAVHTYRLTPHGLYVARSFDAHPRIRHWQAHLLPALHLVACRYDFHDRREHDYYLDVADITCRADVWEVRDLYLDLIVHDGLMAEIVDTDELLAAREVEFISESEMHRAVTVAHRTLSGLARARYSLADWLDTQGVSLHWQDPIPA
ncbi:DUF402 domain-containing protein [Deinococcus taeanensis]|uniref:DUF402 domain-containing protein n=1 Tax=Deinococcus taeanensis TaxID=2737050 RepID=UPI001CDBC66A|nr:DUF402 domain-containing protein [Deinococcus taeanensis]UBV43155.1 DUF402 domain-containing protein [Deinococcus taeanensis]